MEKLFKQNVGIDVSKDTFDAVFVKLTNKQEIKVIAHKKFANSLKGFEHLLNWSNKKKEDDMPISYTMEATGIYYESLAYHLHGQGQSVYVVLPNKAKKYAESLENKSKTDKLDAKSLGQLGAERKLRKWEVMSKSFQKLKQLTREREGIIQERTNIKNQLHAMNNSANKSTTSIKRAQVRIMFLDTQVKEIEKELRHVLAEDRELSEKISKLQTIPGVALITSAIIIAETNGFASIENIKQLTSYSGLDIIEKQSGKWRGKSKISKKGNSHIRKALYFPAFTLIKNDKNMNKLYLRLKEKKKLSMIAAVAVQRKLLGLMYVLWKNNTSYDPEYKQKIIA
ncbi:IS110 family transposase [Bacteroidota bacterium]